METGMPALCSRAVRGLYRWPATRSLRPRYTAAGLTAAQDRRLEPDTPPRPVARPTFRKARRAEEDARRITLFGCG
jgi:hypothetical protein